MKRPSFQFYPADWLGNKNLRRCSALARSAWIDVLCLLHDGDEYGVLRWPLADIAEAANHPIKMLQELASKSVLKGGDKMIEDFTHTPFHAGKSGAPVVLVKADGKACWYSSRMVRDEWIRSRRGGDTRFGDGNQPHGKQPSRSPTGSPTARVGERQGNGLGDGPSASSSASEVLPTGVANSTGGSAVDNSAKPEGDRSPEGQKRIELPEKGWHRTNEGIEAAARMVGIVPNPGELHESVKRRTFVRITELERGRPA